MDAQIARLENGVQPILEVLKVVVRSAALETVVDEIVGPVVRDAGANQPAFDHLVEVAGEPLMECSADSFREL
jgi:hypothetical protein